jgi:hypothetical protein
VVPALTRALRCLTIGGDGRPRIDLRRCIRFRRRAISFLGWLLDVPLLTDWHNNGISIQPNATVATMAAGAALVLVSFGYGAWHESPPRWSH